MRRSATVALMAFLGVAAPAANAVCLLDDYSVLAEFERSEAVVVGRATAARLVADPADPEGFAGILYTVEVATTLRGSPPRMLEMYSENSSGRFPMDLGRSYLLFLQLEADVWTADNCGNSGELGERKAELERIRMLPTLD